MGTGRYRFGIFEFDAPKLELRREGMLVRLQAQPAQVLVCLTERANQVVFREDGMGMKVADGELVFSALRPKAENVIRENCGGRSQRHRVRRRRDSRHAS